MATAALRYGKQAVAVFQCIGAAGNSQEPRPERRKRKRKNCSRTRRPVVIKRDNR